MGFQIPPTYRLFGLPPPGGGFNPLCPNPFWLGPATILGSPSVPTHPPVGQWVYVRQRFTRLLGNLAITPTQRDDAVTKRAGVCACLNRSYWGASSGTANSILIGSWGKQTHVRPPRDVDIVFLLPSGLYHRFQARSGNRQSQLLQEVKDVLIRTYRATTMRADGQVIIVPFNSTSVEVAPGFRCTDGSIIVCDTNNGGRYKTSTAEAESRELTACDAKWNGNARSLIRMMKQWQRECNVPLKSFQIERLAIAFLEVWPYSFRDVFWYDWMVRDFLAYLMRWPNYSLAMPGTQETVGLGSDWLSRAQTAYFHACKACDYEQDNLDSLAGQAWQKLFGVAAPVNVS
jgi:Second Messenger Oligonucleotide or Dinucleotide Synthetase domain